MEFWKVLVEARLGFVAGKILEKNIEYLEFENEMQISCFIFVVTFI